MAEAYISLDRVGLECPICLDKLERPRSLPCLHTFCTKCLKEHILITYEARAGFTFPCPVCRTQTRPAKPLTDTQLWAEHFPVNYWIQSILDEAARPKHSDYAMCDVHKELRINLFCEDDNAVLCPTCVAMYHRSCTNIVEIDKILPGFDIETQREMIKTKIATKQGNVESETNRDQESLDKLSDERRQIEHLVRNKKDGLITHIDELYGKFTEDIDNMFKEIESEICQGDSINHTNKEEISSLNEDLENIDIAAFPKSAFIQLNQMNARLNEMCTIRKHRNPKIRHQTVVYARQDISDTLMKSLSPGELRFSYRNEFITEDNAREDDTGPRDLPHEPTCSENEHSSEESESGLGYTVGVMPMYKQVKHTNTTSNSSMPNTDPLSAKVVALTEDKSLYNHRVLDTRMPLDDARPSWVSGMCRIKTDLLALCDQNSSSIKLLHDRKIVYQFHRRTKPWSVCRVSDVQIAVTFPEERCIHVYDINCNSTTLKLFGTPSVLGDTLKLQRVIATSDRPCYGVACMEDLLFVACEASLDVYTTTGGLLNLLCRYSRTSHEGFIRVMYVVVNPFRRTCYLSDEGADKVHAFDVNDFSIQTDPRYTYTSAMLRSPQGLDFDTNGCVYVCGFVSRNIHVVDVQGHVIKIISTVPQPWTIVVDSSTSKMTISLFPNGPRDVNMYVCKVILSDRVTLPNERVSIRKDSQIHHRTQ